MQTWTLGKTSVTRIEEQVGPNDSTADNFLAGLVRERFMAHAPWMVPVHYDPAGDKLITSNHSWLIRTGQHTTRPVARGEGTARSSHRRVPPGRCGA